MSRAPQRPFKPPAVSWAQFAIIAAGITAYVNSFSAAFVFDCRPWIVQNYHIRKLWPVWEVPLDTSRILTDLSLAVNYAFGGLNPWGYHAVNLAIHVAAGLVLFEVIRLTLLCPLLRKRYESSSSLAAFAIAVLWLVHPLQTQSVTYIIQRSESLMGLCYLGALYCVIRGSQAQSSRWYAAGIILVALGMASKPVMITAPLLIMFYDRTFLSGSVKEAWLKRRGFYLGLIACWALLAVLLASDPSGFSSSVGYGYKGVTVVQYLQTQPAVVLNYLKLAVWPHPLVLDYAWVPATTLSEFAVPVAVVLVLLGLTVWFSFVRPALGFLGVWFFLILAPTSSILPVADLAFEHRMYLPLVAPITLIVLMVHSGLSQIVGDPAIRKVAWVVWVTAAVVVLTALTIRRNNDYQTEESIWRDTLFKRPDNPRAYESLGSVLAGQFRFEEAVVLFKKAIELKPDNWQAQYNLAVAMGRRRECVNVLEQWSDSLGLAAQIDRCQWVAGRSDEIDALKKVIKDTKESIGVHPDDLNARERLARASFLIGRHPESIETFVDLLFAQQQQGIFTGDLARQLSAVGLLNPVMDHIKGKGAP